jgi:hypothetical protein
VTVRLQIGHTAARIAREHLSRSVDRLGFFLADLDGTTFRLRHWRPMPHHAIEPSTGGHAALTDEAASDVLRWAREDGGGLVEVHSHGRLAPAAFSWIDVAGLAEWVPGARWRLGGAPYAAAVTAGETIDAWAWLDGSTEPTQVDAIVIGDTDVVPTTGATLEYLRDDRF